nr:MAG TPA: hypothetical protein [Caudoviricetes sp.]
MIWRALARRITSSECTGGEPLVAEALVNYCRATILQAANLTSC